MFRGILHLDAFRNDNDTKWYAKPFAGFASLRLGCWQGQGKPRMLIYIVWLSVAWVITMKPAKRNTNQC